MRLPTNVKLINVDGYDGQTTEHVIIDRGNGEFTTMLKEAWDAQQAALAQTPFVPEGKITE
jgi:hypothetical protein